MRFTTYLVSGLFAVMASAQTTDSSASTTSQTDTTTAPATTVSQDPAQASQSACFAACGPTDVNCRAACAGVPSPNNSQVNNTDSCVAACVPGNGSAPANAMYSSCVGGCINDNFFATTGTPAATGASDDSGSTASGGAAPTGSSGSSSGSGNASTSGFTNGTANGTSTASGSSASASSAAAPALLVSGGALFGVFAAVLAL